MNLFNKLSMKRMPFIFSIYLISWSDNFDDFFSSRYPFDWKTPIGYAVCIFIQLSKIHLIVEVYTSGMVVTIGYCLFVYAFVSDIEEKLLQLNENVVGLDGKKLTARDQTMLMTKFSEIIEFHTEARE